MAYAAVISLKQTIQRLLNSSRFSQESLRSASEEAASLQSVLKRLDDHGGGGGERLEALDGRMREAASKLEDFLILHQSDNGGDELVISSEMMRRFAETAKKLREDYAAELDKDVDGGGGGDGGGGASSSETEHMVGYSDELNDVKWHMRNAVRPDDWAAASIFGRPGTGRSYTAWEVFQYARQLQTFDCGVWVTVTPNTHRKSILRAIFNQALINLNHRKVALRGGTVLKGSDEDDEEFAIRVNLVEILARQRYMIVLDNVDDIEMLEYLVHAFPVQNNGSVVLVTSSAVDIMKHPALLLIDNSEDQALQYEDIWWGLMQYKLLGWQPVSPELEEVGRKAVRNCRGRFFCFVKLIFLLWNADRSVEAWSRIAHDERHPIFHEIIDELSDVRKIKEDFDNFTTSDKAVLSNLIEHIDKPTGIQLMKEKLFPQRKFFPKMEVISFVGMAGIGKTTFVKKVYEYVQILSEYENIDVRYYEHCVWLTLGPKYKSEDIFIDIIAQIFPDIDKMVIRGDAELVGNLIQVLQNKRLFIVLDDVWSEAPLEHLAKSFPNIKGRAMVTTRIGKVARSEKMNMVREMHLLSKEESWKLLCEKVFVEEGYCPFDLRRSGKKIAENCDGLPLTILKVASLVSTNLTAEYWDDVAKKNLDFVNVLQDLSETLVPIYNNLPQYLKPCFLYMGVFPEKSEVSASRIVKLWSAEGFLEQGDEEEFAAECLSELVDRNLVMSVAETTCRLNSVLWYLTNTEAARSSFFYVLRGTTYHHDSIKAARRFCIRNCILLSIKQVYGAMMGSASTAHSFICSGAYHQYPVPVCWELRLLRVLDAAAIRFYDFPIEAVELIHLRHLAITCDGDLPPTISKLWNLQYLIVSRHLRLSGDSSYLPMEIWDMKELKHLQVTGSNLPSPNTGGTILPNLVTLLDVGYHTFTEEVLRGIPNLQKLGIQIDLPPGDVRDPFHHYLNRISSLSKLESLDCVVVNLEVEPAGVAPPAPRSMFPPCLERLSLSGLGYPWEYMGIIEELKNLKVLELQGYAFQGDKWETGDGTFTKLERLAIEDTDLVWWKATVLSFRELKHLSIKHCYMLEEVPSVVLMSHETIEVVDCNPLAAANWKEIIRMRGGSIALPTATDRHSKLHMDFSWEVAQSSLPGVAASALRPPPPVHLHRHAVTGKLRQGQVKPSRAEMHRDRDRATSPTGAMHHDPLMQDPPRRRRGMGDADVDEISTTPSFPFSGSYPDVEDHQMHLFLKQIQLWYTEQQQRLAVQEQPSMSGDELGGGGGGGGGDASSSETDDSDDADMVGCSDELKAMKWHMRKAVRPDDWAAASIFGRPGTGRTYAAWEIFQYAREVEAFECCVWAAVGPSRHRKAVLLGILCLLLNIVNGGDRGGDGTAAEVGEDDMLFEVSKEDYVRGGVASLLEGRKYMIVLDYVDDTGMLEYLLTAFPVQNNGSLVLVTTGAVDVSNHPSLRLTSTNLEDRGLQYEDMWWGLLRCKVSGAVSPELEEVGRKAVRNCRGRFFCFVKLIFFLWNTDWSVEAWSRIAHHQHHPIFNEIIDELSDVRKIKEDLNNFIDTDKAVLSHFIEDIDAPTGVQFMKEKLFPKRKFFPTMEVISFVGMAGIGKTTLVKKVYEYVKILSEYQYIDLPNYEHCVWLTLGPKYESEDIFIDILARIFPDIDKMVIREDAELAADLIQVLQNKRLLIVLDDVWSEAPLEHLAKSFPNIKGRALVTTRIGKVARSEKIHIVLKIPSLLSRNLIPEYWNNVAKKNSDFVSALQDLSERLEAAVEEQRPAAPLLPPCVSSATPRPLSPTLQTRFAKFMSDAASAGRVMAMVLKESDGNSLEYDFFADVVDQSKDLVIGAIDLYMLALRVRVIAKNVLLQSVDSDNTIICDTDLFIYLNNEWLKICNQWCELQSAREEGHVQFGDQSYRDWRPDEEWANAIRGVGIPNTQRSWINATQVIVPCLVGSHYVVCRLDLHEGICELYDSLHYCLNEDTRAYRVQQLFGILKLLPRLLLFGEWFTYSPIRSPNFQNRMEFILRVAAPTLQFNQADNVSCGVFCCMQVERLIADSPSIEWGHGHVPEYRWNIAARIFDLCKTPAVELEDSRVCPDLSN